MVNLRVHTRIPNLPSNTCPAIDDVISTLEELREANTLLRDVAEKWQEEAEYALGELDKAESQRDDLQETVNELENKISELEVKANG